MHERYAHLRANGHKMPQAYVATGRCPDQSSASKWERRHPMVRLHIQEIRSEIAARMVGAAAGAESLSASPVPLARLSNA